MRDHKQNEIANYVAFREGERERGEGGREMGMTDEGALPASEQASVHARRSNIPHK